MLLQWLMIVIGIIILILAGIILCYLWVKWEAAPHLSDEIENIPFHETALVLGTAKFTSRGGVNLFYQYRIKAAHLIFSKQKAGRIIVSGANRDPDQNKEAAMMKASLVALHVPSGLIIVDSAGYRTWDSLWRCRNVYDVYAAIVISQRFHNERAIFIGRRFGMALVGYNARPVGGKVAVRMFLRECLARVKCILDCFILNPEPVFLKRKKGS